MPTNFRLKGAIYQAGRRQVEIAQAVGLTELQMSIIVTGRKEPSDDLKVRIAQELGISAAEIFAAESVAA